MVFPVLRRAGWLLAFAVSAGAMASGAQACLPPLPGERIPTEEEMLREVARSAPDIAYGRIVRGSDRGGRPLFRVIHVYKGSLRPAQRIRHRIGWGIPGTMCPGMISPPPVSGGWNGVAVIGSSDMFFLTPDQVASLLRQGLLTPGPHDRRAPAR
jgi:hypothetical protein